MVSDEIEIHKNFVPPAIRPSADMIPLREVAGQPIALPTNGETDANALMGISATSEKSTPLQRADATVKKLLVYCIAATVIALASMILTDDIAIIATVEIVGLLIACVVTIWLDRNDSPLATERKKSGDYKAIRLAEIAAQERMFDRRMDGYERVVGDMLNANNRTK